MAVFAAGPRGTTDTQGLRPSDGPPRHCGCTAARPLRRLHSPARMPGEGGEGCSDAGQTGGAAAI
eukprot:356451-Chlamydomonas_euryale.AAC.1